MPTCKTGVVLLNMGGPESLEDVAPFLHNLFSDRHIIRLGPPFLQEFLARIIARRRAPESREIYRQIGGGSPLRRISCEQAQALELSLQTDGDFLVRVAMRYWQPRVEEVLLELRNRQVERLIALPLYPHYSEATSGSSLLDLRQARQRLMPMVPLHEITCWPDHPLYIQALVHAIEEAQQRCAGGSPQLVYSAHSLPQAVIDRGDPYLKHLHRTIGAIEEKIPLRGKLCFQSRSGPVRWLAPATLEVIAELAGTACTEIVMVPISFVSDHVETLYEINILFAGKARQLGIGLKASPSLNTRSDFIACLRALVLEAANHN